MRNIALAMSTVLTVSFATAVLAIGLALLCLPPQKRGPTASVWGWRHKEGLY